MKFLQKKLQIKSSCCKFFKTNCCKLKECCRNLKHQKYARALKEGGVSIRILLFLSGKLLYFFLGLCDYSDKFPKMFCSSCGGEQSHMVI